MRKLRLTSPGALLIVAIGLAGAIVLLDAFFLRPYVEAQKDAALREQAFETRQGLSQALQAEQNLLSGLCGAHARHSQLPTCLTQSNQFGPFIREAVGSGRVSLAWLSDPGGQVLCAWSGDDDLGAVGATEAAATQAAKAILTAGSQGGAAHAGVVEIGGRAALFAQASVAAPAGSGEPPGVLNLARFIDPAMLKTLGAAINAEVVWVPGPSNAPEKTAARDYWPTSDDRLAVPCPLSGVGGAPLGYFRADVPVAVIYGQAAAARRIVLIILSLSFGLVCLVILGTHMLISGPVVRLLQRLHQLDSGEGTLKALTHDLHGEPLVLARRLESAFQRLAHMSETDQLTGLANRRHFQEVLSAFYHQSRRYNRPLSVILMDVDYFKAVNDSAGHPVGDEVLKWVAAAIEKACRKADLPARMGGDEFAVLLPETLSDDAERVAERIRLNVCSEPAVVKDLRLNLTASIGVADLNCGEIDGPEKMIVLADRALYAAKEAGRNRVILAHHLEGGSLASGGQEQRKVDLLARRLAGLDDRFKDLFLQGLGEIVAVLEFRDPHMAEHARKVQRYVELIAREMGLPQRVLQRLRVAAMLHDIGMLAMPDTVLMCPTTLSEEQVKQLKRHPLVSVRIMERMEFLEHEIPAVRYHHERYDGRGYPEALAGAAIPLTARILAVADTFDAITSPRTFRNAKTVPQALEEIRQSAGAQFDPTVVDAFTAVAGRLGPSLVETPPTSLAETPRDKSGRTPWRESASEEALPAAGAPPHDASTRQSRG